MIGELALAQDVAAGGGDLVIVFHRAPANPDGSEQLAILDDRQAAGKGNETAIRVLDAVERPARLRQLAELARAHGEEAGGPGLLDGDVDRADPGIVHADEGAQIRP